LHTIGVDFQLHGDRIIGFSDIRVDLKPKGDRFQHEFRDIVDILLPKGDRFSDICMDFEPKGDRFQHEGNDFQAILVHLAEQTCGY
jgi:hypothetical protein